MPLKVLELEMAEELHGCTCLRSLYCRGPPSSSHQLFVGTITNGAAAAIIEGNGVYSVGVDDHKARVGRPWVQTDGAFRVSKLEAEPELSQRASRKMGSNPTLEILISKHVHRECSCHTWIQCSGSWRWAPTLQGSHHIEFPKQSQHRIHARVCLQAQHITE